MATTNEENWMMRYNEPNAYIAMYYHFPDKHKVEFHGLLNWTKYNIPKENQGRCFARKLKTQHVFSYKNDFSLIDFIYELEGVHPFWSPNYRAEIVSGLGKY